MDSIPFSEIDNLIWAYALRVPRLDAPYAWALGILNFILPGVGTIIAALLDHMNMT